MHPNKTVKYQEKKFHWIIYLHTTQFQSKIHLTYNLISTYIYQISKWRNCRFTEIRNLAEAEELEESVRGNFSSFDLEVDRNGYRRSFDDDDCLAFAANEKFIQTHIHTHIYIINHRFCHKKHREINRANTRNRGGLIFSGIVHGEF